MCAQGTLRLEWVNHASFVVSYNGVRLITDPWLFGPAFNNGWSLLSETRFKPEDFDSITHIWLSHEHPDHFSPPVLKSIPEELRRKIKFLYQKTEDGKVKRYCEGLGFEVHEMEHGETYELADGFSVTCAPVLDDSWLLIETPACRILNINDCVINKPYLAQAIKKYSGEVDVLMTQFSYANWVGNPDDPERRRQNALEKLSRIKLQMEVFKPRYVIPFASFVWFSHRENFYLNDTVNRISDVAARIREWGGEPVVLYPGDTWVPGGPHQTDSAIAKYEKDLSAIRKRKLTESKPCDWSEVEAAAKTLVERVHRQNNMLSVRLAYALRLFRPANIFLTDRNQAYRFDVVSGLRPVPLPEAQCDISMHSESFLYALKFDWGADTLHVNGRFTSPDGNSYLNFFINFFLPKHNNNGRRFPFGVIMGYLREGLLLDMLKRLASVRVGA